MARRLGRVIARAARFDEELMPAMMIYVGNLDYATTSEELRALFEPFGAVAMAEVQVKARTGQSRGSRRAMSRKDLSCGR